MRSDLLTALVMLGVGLAVTGCAITGIVFLARALGKTKSAGVIVAAVLGIVCLVGFVLVGLFATGCGAILATS